MPPQRRSRRIQPALDRELAKRRETREQQSHSQTLAPVLTESHIRVMGLPHNPSTGRPAMPSQPTSPLLRPTVSSHHMEQLQQDVAQESAALLAIPPLTTEVISTALAAARPDRLHIYRGEYQSFPFQSSASSSLIPALSGSLIASSSASLALTSAPVSISNPPLSGPMSFEAATFGLGSDVSNEERRQTAIIIQNQRDIAAAVTRAHLTVQENRARSTQRTYTASQKKFKDWCENRQFHDRDTVHEGKLLAYLQYELFVKGNQSAGKNKGQMLSREAIEAHVKAIVDLYVVIFVFLSDLV